MSENQDQPGRPSPADDVEGHGARFNGYTDEPAQDDVEGHLARGRGAFTDEQQPDDVEGHAIKFRP